MTVNEKIDCVLSLTKIYIDPPPIACRIKSKLSSKTFKSFYHLFPVYLLKHPLLPLFCITCTWVASEHSKFYCIHCNILSAIVLGVSSVYTATLLLKIKYICFILQTPVQTCTSVKAYLSFPL